MLTKDKIIGIFCFIDDLLKTINHYEDSRRRVSDSEIITTAVASSFYFGGHQDKARQFMKMTGMIPEMLDKSRFNRRLHAVAELVYNLFMQYFRTNYSFTNNSFTNNASGNTANAINFYHIGFTPPEWNYLLTAQEGTTLQTGSTVEKKAILLNNFGIDVNKIRISGNTYSSKITTQFALGTFSGYGATSRGFSGWVNLTSLVNKNTEPFGWERSE